MNGTELRSLTTGLWANSKVVFRLEDGTPLELTSHHVLQPSELSKNGRRDVKEGSPVPTGPPTLMLILRVQSPSPSGTEPTPHSTPTTGSVPSTSAKSAGTAARAGKRTVTSTDREYIPDIDEVRT